MAKVTPIRDFNNNEIMLTAFGDWLNDRTRATFEEKTDAETNACVAGVRRFGSFIDPKPLSDSTLAELRAFRADLLGRVLRLTRLLPGRARFIRPQKHVSKRYLSTEDRSSSLLGITMFEGFRREVLQKV
jgi:hypothetical protein